MHVSDGGIEVIGIEILIGEGNEAWSTVISEVDENLALGSRLQNLTISTFYLGGVTLEDGEEVLWSDRLTLVVDVAASVDIFTVRLVEEFAWDRVLWVSSDIIVAHNDNV